MEKMIWGIVFVSAFLALLGFFVGYFSKTKKWFSQCFNLSDSIGFYIFLGILSVFIFFVLYK